MNGPTPRMRGFTLMELLISLAIGGLLIAAVSGLLLAAQDSAAETRVETRLHRSASFALDRMVRAVEGSRTGFLPLAENPATPWSESRRNLLAVAMDPRLDRDRDGWSDANNDRDWMDYNANAVRDPGEPERIDEDPGDDVTDDNAPGLVGVDDDNDGAVDENMQFEDPSRSNDDDDEDGWRNDDHANGVDDDGDGAIDEDLRHELNDDYAAGVIGVDDNFDGIVDDHPAYVDGPTSRKARRDDDEDGDENEDWPDPVLYYLGATNVRLPGQNFPHGDPNTLYERFPAAAAADGRDFDTRIVATQIGDLVVERLHAVAGDEAPLFRITVVARDDDGHEITVTRTARLGARL